MLVGASNPRPSKSSTLYIMSWKDARKSQSAFFLSGKTAERKTDNNNLETTRQPKRTREQLEAPTIVVENVQETGAKTTPTATIPEQTLDGNRATVKLDRVYDKIDRYNSHNEFLRKCITNNVIPISYKVGLEPSIGNHDENFLKGYFDMLESFSKQVMNYTADYCISKITDFEVQQDASEKELFESTSNEVFVELKKTLNTNKDKRKKALKEIKERKFIRLKYHARPTNRHIPHDDVPAKPRNVGGQLYAQVVKRKPSRQNINQGSVLKRNSTTNFQRNDVRVQSNQLDHKINDLERELNQLRETQRQHRSKIHQINQAEKNTTQHRQSKNGGAPPRGTQEQDKPAQHRNQRSPGVHIKSNGNFRRIRETIQKSK